MAQVILTMSGSAIGEISVGYDLTDTDAGRILQWAADQFDPEEQGPVFTVNQLGEHMLKNLLVQIQKDETAAAVKRATIEAQSSVRPIEAVKSEL